MLHRNFATGASLLSRKKWSFCASKCSCILTLCDVIVCVLKVVETEICEDLLQEKDTSRIGMQAE